MLTVAFTDFTFEGLTVEEPILKPTGCRIVARQCKSTAELIELTRDADVVVTQFAKINAQVIAEMKLVRAIARYGIGVDNVDLEAAREHGIPVCNVPDYCIDEVADQTLAFILALTRRVPEISAETCSGHWRLSIPLSAIRVLKEQTVGVVGFGRIGREVCRRLVAFKCSVLVFDPIAPAGAIRDAGCVPASLDEVLAQSDVLTLHCPSTANTRNMINAASLAKMKRGALLVNVARGDLVDPTALVAALQSGQLSGAALDVFETEPIPAGHPIMQLSNVLLSPHMASCSQNAVRRLRESVAQHAVRALEGKPPICVVNGVTAAQAAASR